MIEDRNQLLFNSKSVKGEVEDALFELLFFFITHIAPENEIKNEFDRLLVNQVISIPEGYIFIMDGDYNDGSKPIKHFMLRVPVIHNTENEKTNC